MTDNDPDESGDFYTLTAMESDTKLFISHHEGGRSTDDATELFNDLESKRSNTSPIPAFAFHHAVFLKNLVSSQPYNVSKYAINTLYNQTL